jgi:hypothetical protein
MQGMNREPWPVQKNSATVDVIDAYEYAADYENGKQ